MSHAICRASRGEKAGAGAGAGAEAEAGGATQSMPSRDVDEALRAQIIQNALAVDPAVERLTLPLSAAFDHGIRSWRERRTANAHCMDSAETHTAPPKETYTTPPQASEFLSEGMVAVEPPASWQQSLSQNIGAVGLLLSFGEGNGLGKWVGGRGGARGADDAPDPAPRALPPPPPPPPPPNLESNHVQMVQVDIAVAAGMYPPPHMTCMYPPPHMTCMYPPPHMTYMYPRPHMTCMYPPPHMTSLPPQRLRSHESNAVSAAPRPHPLRSLPRAGSHRRCSRRYK
jgi:hypothetical protein